MLDLFLAIIFSAAIPVLLKYAHRRHLNDKVILSYNYLIALCVSLIFTWIKMDSYSALVKGSYSLFMLIGIGMVTGLAYYLAFYFYQHSVRENGV
ncbi:MAG: hypothetical protein PF505_05595 [Vallitaleaceae bacterium]|jgi:apolipoprotein N-acyltransferase|nr:hypothetical protein [Vallitaleaceae bacterium]